MHRLLLVATALVVALLVLPFAGLHTSRAQPGYADLSFENTRDRLDRPIDAGQTSRTWFWGPEPISDGILEPYAESPGGERLVQYIDKARFELTNPDGDPSNPWHVTTGLLTRELISGSVQVSAALYEQREPSDRAMAGDAANVWPTYAGFDRVIDQLYADMTGEAVTSVLLQQGVTSYPDAEDDPGAELVQYLEYDGPTGPVGYNIPSAFWEFMHTTGITWDGIGYGPSAPLMDWMFIMGLPISDPFWVSVELDGTPEWVLIQAFERRVLTYTPSNPEGWHVEMGNVGRHYFEWRHDGETPQEPPATATPTEPEVPPATVTPTEPEPPEEPPFENDPGPGSDHFAMRVGNIWAYQDTETGEYTIVEITGRSTEFIEGEWLLVREETRPDGNREVSYWNSDENLLWLHGYEEFDTDGELLERVVYNPPVRYLLDDPQLGTGWGTDTWIEYDGIPVTLVRIAVKVNSLLQVSTPAGQFQTYSLTVTETLTDGDNLIGTPLSVRQFDFAPYYGIVHDRPGDGVTLELVAYSLQ